MKRRLKYFFWIFSNEWAGVFGWRWLAPLHRISLNLTLHALGYDNPRYSGEGWFIRTILAKKDIQVCLDVGANVGNYSAELVDELDCTVYAIEPLTSTFRALEARAKELGNKIIPLHFAIADYVGEATIIAKADLAETAVLTSINEHDTSSILKSPIQEKVSLITIDELVRQMGIKRIDFIKIDTEGFEREVVRGMGETLKTLKPKFIQFEFNIMQLKRGYTVLDMQKLLPRYTLYRLLPHGWLKINPQSFADNIFMFQNIVAMRNDIY